MKPFTPKQKQAKRRRISQGFASLTGFAVREKIEIGIAEIVDVPSHIAGCPECGSLMQCQMTTPDIRDLHVECKREARTNALNHRHGQGEWEPWINAVRKWFLRTYKLSAGAASREAHEPSEPCALGEDTAMAGNK